MVSFRNDALNAHNQYRSKHGAPPLKWSSELESSAQRWANQLAKKGYLQHDKQQVEGENLACMKGRCNSPIKKNRNIGVQTATLFTFSPSRNPNHSGIKTKEDFSQKSIILPKCWGSFYHICLWKRVIVLKYKKP